MSEYLKDNKEISPTFIDHILVSLLTFKDDIPNYIRKISCISIGVLIALNSICLYATYRAYDALHNQIIEAKADTDKQLRGIKAKDYEMLTKLKELQGCIHSEQKKCTKTGDAEDGNE